VSLLREKEELDEMNAPTDSQGGMAFEVASKLASEAVAYLDPYCIRLQVVGSVRRQKPGGIHDIEVLCVPKLVESETTLTPVPALRPETVETLLVRAPFGYGRPDKNGRAAPFSDKYYRLTYKQEGFDLFVCQPPAEWGLLELIRTGPADFSHEFVTRLWEYGLRSRDGHIEDAKGKRVPTPEEADAFRACRLQYIEPKDRTVEKLRRGLGI
jgi:DNA polymerase/3'-5' exonuclease PolX